MKIAVIAHLKYPIAEPFFGGLEMHTHLLVSKLAERGHAVTLFAANSSSAERLDAIIPPTGLLDDDREQDVDRVEVAAYTTIVERIRRETFDLIHCNALHYFPLQCTAELSAPMVAVLHTPPFDPLGDAVRSCKEDVAFVAVSATLAAQWPTVNPVVISNGIDLSRFEYRPEADADRFAFWFGRIVPEKGLHLAIDAASAAGLPLRIAGPMIDPVYWETEIAPRLGGPTIYLGHLEQAEIAAILGRASVLVCTPRWEEPFGLVVVEALACGTPVAGFARGALPDILDVGCGALATADDVAALAIAITMCLNLERSACRARALSFDADTMIMRYEAVYRDTISRRALARDDGQFVSDANPT